MRLFSVWNTHTLRPYYPLLVLLVHSAVLSLGYFIMVRWGIISPIVCSDLMRFDAGWYASIVNNGYTYVSASNNNTAFFPLFPLVWRLLIWFTGSLWSICIFNILLFIAGLNILKTAFGFSWKWFLVLLSLPPVMFMMVPYTEALFFFFSSVLLAGLRTGNRYMIMGGLFLAGITRPVAMFFIPIVLLVEILSFRDRSNFLRNVLVYSTIPLLSLAAVFGFQYIQTSTLFGFFNAHEKLFRHKFAWPELPLNTWGGPEILLQDGFAIYFGIVAAATLLIFFWRRIWKQESDKQPDRPILFALSYVAVTGLYILFFNGPDKEGGTNLISSGRYITATAYFAILVQWLAGSLTRDLLLRAACFILLLATFFLFRTNGSWFASYNLTEQIVYKFVFAAHIGLYLIGETSVGQRFLPLIYLCNIPIQIYLLALFLYGYWVG